MTFVLQKMIWFLILPTSVTVVLLCVGLALINRRKHLGQGLILLGVLNLYVLSLPSTADLILKPLEERYAPVKIDNIAVDAVVVPGGGSVDLDWIGAAPEPNPETLSRLVTGVDLAKRLKVPLVLCGGNGEPFATKVNDADAMERVACAMGMPKNQLIVENASRNTLENSYAVRKLVKGNRIVLATSAYYMRRAVAMFSRRGFTVIAAPTYFQVQTRKFSFNSFIPKAGDLDRSTVGIAEWASMAWWHVRGEI
jgi:uncharacterized SAM-binding protein YcdF (DUF218 family)